MTAVDPFTIPIPKAVTKMPDQVTQEDIAELTATFEYLWQHLHDMWVRSGAETDNVAAVEDVIVGDALALPDEREPVWDQPGWQFFVTS